MPEKVTIEEKIVELSILKAKEIIQELTHGKADIENKDPLVGEDVKVKRPKKNPKEVKVKNPVGKEGYGLAGQVSKMQEIHKAVNVLLKEAEEEGGSGFLNPNITSNEADPSEKDEKRDVWSARGVKQVERIGRSMDKLLEQLKSGNITDRQYVHAMSPLLANMKKYLSAGSDSRRPQL